MITINNQGAGNESSATLDKEELALVAKVAANPLFADRANWSNVSFNYNSSNSNQKLVLNFGPSGNDLIQIFFTIAAEARSTVYNLTDIKIKDQANGTLTIKRSDLVSPPDIGV